jgi:hypothetical protein
MWPTILLLMTGFAGGVIFILVAEISILALLTAEGGAGAGGANPTPLAEVSGYPPRPLESVWRGDHTAAGRGPFNAFDAYPVDPYRR